ncbi:GEVED domain-containing protein [Hymenobacter sp. ASUV-10]|uniref:GEVED domain-containing protein n=1 Tax=Hymenobacter aranciens TaxID=3063996 RepID=A0ABT9B9P3_9BACT|nr:GEVED domain-containing protein [Hymenobacter sp. ASUV-10]MDO7874892.1 GEVED domain-containing protein [Hymenobacter sp. ASUV-10]
MKKTFYSVALGLAGLALTSSPVLAQGPQHRNCGSMDVLAQQMAADPGLAQRMASIDNQALQFAAQKTNAAQRGAAAAITIPVVVHVLYNTTAQNISDAQIQSQIDVLNADFQKLNSDASSVPSAFASLAANPSIGFVLAKRDPSGNATTGIERKQVTQTSWGTDDKMKKTTTGGLNAWPSGSYLNLWVCNLSGGVLGYAQFPGGATATDGVVILTTAFGKGGSATAPFNLGRTGTHEVGHWLNLYHIWGDDGTACTGSDQVSDTPNQADENYGAPTYPQPSCSNTSDMFMNYMDYVDDRAMYMFSTGQSTRMNALFATGGSRASLKTSLGGTAPGGGTTPPPTTVTYCTSKGTSVGYEWIDLVQLGSINRSSAANAGYYDGSATSTNLAVGSNTISYSAGFASTGYTEYWKIYIDYNQDGDFTDSGELVASRSSNLASTLSSTFTVPATAKNGATRLRLVMSDNSATTSCGSFSYGETEDYTVTITGGASARSTRLAAGADQFRLYPNPASSVLNIARPATADAELPLTVRVYDLRGAEIHGLTLAGEQLQVSTLAKGIYLLTVSDGQTTSHQRFVKE